MTRVRTMSTTPAPQTNTMHHHHHGTHLWTESDDNERDDQDELARELANEFVQRLQNSNVYVRSDGGFYICVL